MFVTSTTPAMVTPIQDNFGKNFMKTSIVKTTLIVIALLLSASLSFAAENKPESQAATKAKASAKSATQKEGAAVAKIKLVDINSATKEELKKLPSINDAQAAKIIAGRPYGSKAWLLSHNIIDAAVYESLKQQVIAKQPNKDAAKNAALYSNKKK